MTDQRFATTQGRQVMIHAPGGNVLEAHTYMGIHEAEAARDAFNLEALEAADAEGARKAQENWSRMSPAERANQRRAIATAGKRNMGSSGDRI